MNTIRPVELDDLLDAQPSLVVLDVRTPVEYSDVHIRHARNVPLATLNPKALEEAGALLKDKPVYLICRTGARAAKAAEKFAADGFENAIVVEGGTVAWTNAALPVERGTARVISLERQVRIAAGLLVLSGVLLGWLVHPWFIGLSAFVGVGLIFAGITDFCGMGLLLARLPWNSRASS
jgi:rhodanese-related sulfurtransferase